MLGIFPYSTLYGVVKIFDICVILEYNFLLICVKMNTRRNARRFGEAAARRKPCGECGRLHGGECLVGTNA